MAKISFSRRIRALFYREAMIIGKDHGLLLTLLIAPLLYAFFYGSIYMYKEEEHVKIAMVDADNSALSRMFAQQVRNAQVASLIKASDLNDAKEKLYHGDCQGFFYIEKGFEEKILQLKQSNIVLAVNSARFLPSNDLLGAVTQISLTIGAGVRLTYYKSKGLNGEVAMQQTMPVNLDYKPLYNERGSYGAFLLPGLLALILQQTLLIGIVESVASERKKRTLTELFSISGGNYSLAMWGKGAFYLLLFCCYALFFFNVNFSILGLPRHGSGLALAFITVLFMLTLIPMGMLIGSLFRSPLLAMQLMAFSTYPFFLISGYSWPLQSLPVFLQWLAACLPTTPFLKIYVSVVQQGGVLIQNKEALYHLILLWFVYSLLCVWRFGRLSKIDAFPELNSTANGQPTTS